MVATVPDETVNPVRDTEIRQVVDTLNRVINGLQKQLQEVTSKRHDTINLLHSMAAETRCERDTATEGIEGIENKVRESDKKEGETTGCGKMKKLVAVAVVVLLMVVSFTNYGVNRG